MNLQSTIRSLEELSDFAKSFVENYPPPRTIGLIGDLGAGKTTLVGKIAEQFDIKDVSSPTYILQHEYASEEIKIEHWDLYRLNSTPEEVFEPYSKKAYRFIEWADKFEDLAEVLDLLVEIEIKEQNFRSILIREY